MRSHALVLSVALLAACASAEFAPSGGADLAPYAGEVAVLERLPPPGAYRLLGIVKVTGVGLTSDARMFEQLKEQAAARGADAVVPQGGVRERIVTSGGEERILAAYAIRRR